MSFIDGNSGLSAADVAAVTGNNGFGGFGGDGAWWLIILLLFFNNGNWGGNNYGGANQQAEVQRGFDQAALMNELNGISGSLIANQNANVAQMNSLAMSLQNCCCENRAATADVKYAIATESAATRAASQAGTQQILDKLCALELDGVKQNYENRIANMQAQISALTSQINEANRQASQTAQTAQILRDNAAQTVALEQYLNPAPIPAYMVQNPNCCGQPFYNSSCCGNA